MMTSYMLKQGKGAEEIQTPLKKCWELQVQRVIN